MRPFGLWLMALGLLGAQVVGAQAADRFSMEAPGTGGKVGAGIPANLSVATSQVQVTGPQRTEGDPSVREVIGKGYGADRQEAFEQACRDAIECAVGLWVDSESLVENFELKKDEILTQSNGYIVKDGTQVMWEGPTTQGYCVQLKAKVKMQEVTRKIKDIAPVATAGANPLGGLLASAQTKGSRDARAAALLKRELDSLDPVRQLYGIRLVNDPDTPNPTLVTDEKGNPKRDNGLYIVRYLYEIYPLTDVYFDVFVPRFTQLLQQISVREPRTFYPQIKRERHPEPDKIDASWPGKRQTFSGWQRQGDYYRIGYNQERKQSALSGVSGYIDGRKDEGAVLSVVTLMNASLTAMTVKDYFLAPTVADVYRAWEEQYYSDKPNCVEYFLRIQDAEGNVLSQTAFCVPTGDVLYHSAISGSGGMRGSSAQRIEWIPLLQGYWVSNDNYAKTLRGRLEIKLSEADMMNARIVSIGLMDWMQ